MSCGCVNCSFYMASKRALESFVSNTAQFHKLSTTFLYCPVDKNDALSQQKVVRRFETSALEPSVRRLDYRLRPCSVLNLEIRMFLFSFKGFSRSNPASISPMMVKRRRVQRFLLQTLLSFIPNLPISYVKRSTIKISREPRRF